MKNIPLFKKYEDIFLKNSQIKEFLLKNLVHKHFRKRTPVVNIGTALISSWESTRPPEIPRILSDWAALCLLRSHKHTQNKQKSLNILSANFLAV